MKRNDEFDKRIIIAIATIIIIVLAQLVVNEPKTIIDAEPAVEYTPELLVIKPIDFTPKPEKVVIVPVRKPKPVAVAPSGTCMDWIIQAGVPMNQQNAAYQLIMRESGCRPNAQNPYSSAYGIPQSLPGSKMASAGADWQTNPVTQIKWMIGYVNARYGGFPQALAFQLSRNWY